MLTSYPKQCLDKDRLVVATVVTGKALVRGVGPATAMRTAREHVPVRWTVRKVSIRVWPLVPAQPEVRFHLGGTEL